MKLCLAIAVLICLPIYSQAKELNKKDNTLKRSPASQEPYYSGQTSDGRGYTLSVDTLPAGYTNVYLEFIGLNNFAGCVQVTDQGLKQVEMEKCRPGKGHTPPGG